MPGNKLLLLVQDEPLIALALQDALESAGYRVLIAEDGQTGADALADSMQEVSALITDIRLGSGPDGWGLARQARAKRSTLPILYVTGDSAHEWSSNGVPGSVQLRRLPHRVTNPATSAFHPLRADVSKADTFRLYRAMGQES